MSRVAHSLVENKACFPDCESFKCSQRSLTRVGNKMYCRWADDDCVGPTCNYALCIRGRILSNGVCGLTIKRKTNDQELNTEVIKLNEIKIKGKLLHRIGEDDLI